MGGPFWVAPVEVARGLADVQGTAQFVRLIQRGARFQPHATIHLKHGAFVAEVGFEDPAYPGQVHRTAVRLGAPPQENAA